MAASVSPGNVLTKKRQRKAPAREPTLPFLVAGIAAIQLGNDKETHAPTRINGTEKGAVRLLFDGLGVICLG